MESKTISAIAVPSVTTPPAMSSPELTPVNSPQPSNRETEVLQETEQKVFLEADLEPRPLPAQTQLLPQ